MNEGKMEDAQRISGFGKPVDPLDEECLLAVCVSRLLVSVCRSCLLLCVVSARCPVSRPLVSVLRARRAVPTLVGGAASAREFAACVPPYSRPVCQHPPGLCAHTPPACLPACCRPVGLHHAGLCA